MGESSREDWYNRRTGRLYISHFKTNKSRLGSPYDFDLKNIPELKNAIDHTLRPDHPQADRKYLVGVGVYKDRLPASVGEKIIQAFKSAGLVYKYVN
jgi:Fe-S oxidoreductase